MSDGPGSAKLSRRAAVNASAVSTRRAGTPIPLERATKSRRGR